MLRFRAAGWVFAAKALDVTLTTTVNGTSRQLLYRGIRRESRLTARALADGLYLPLAIGLAGAGLGVVSGSVSVSAAAIASAVGCAVWILFARRAHRAYVSGLLDALKAGRFGTSEEPLVFRDSALRAWLREAFTSASDEDVIYLAAVLPQLARLVDPDQLRAALARESPKVKVAILQSLRAGGLKQGPALARSLVGHPDAEVRCAAILAASDSIGGGVELERLTTALADPEPRVRAAAAAGLVNSTDGRARAMGRGQLDAMVRSESPELRRAAAEALEHVENRSASDLDVTTRLLASLVEDPEISVVLAALETTRSRRYSALARQVLALLERPLVAGAAVDALVAMGPAAVGPVLSAFEERAGGRGALVERIPEVLERIGDPRGLKVIATMLTTEPPEQRGAVFRSYVRLLARERAAQARHERLDTLVEEECRAAAARLESVKRLGWSPGVRLARDAISDLVACHVQNAFILLVGCVPNTDMMALHWKIVHGTREERSHALELLENVLPRKLRAPLLGVLEPDSVHGGTEPGAEVLELLSERDSEWVVAGAAWSAAELGLVSCVERLESLKGHESPVVRETALFAIERLGGAR